MSEYLATNIMLEQRQRCPDGETDLKEQRPQPTSPEAVLFGCRLDDAPPLQPQEGRRQARTGGPHDGGYVGVEQYINQMAPLTFFFTFYQFDW